MSQVVACQRCGRASELKCDLCPDMLPLCRECAPPHYNLMHDMDFYTRATLPPRQKVSGTPFGVTTVKVTVGDQGVKVLDVKLRGRRTKAKSPQKVITDYIKKLK